MGCSAGRLKITGKNAIVNKIFFNSTVTFTFRGFLFVSDNEHNRGNNGDRRLSGNCAIHSGMKNIFHAIVAKPTYPYTSSFTC